MPIKTNLDVAPYFDDYSANNNYYRILFKPTVAVQARELTQAQSIMQNQIEQFGNWAFQNGDIVSGCRITDLPAVPYVYLSDLASNGATYSASALANLQVVSANTGLSARVISSVGGLVANYPNTTILYLSYNNSGSNSSSNSIQNFSNTDQLQFFNLPRTGNLSIDLVATINAYSNSTANTFTTGNAHGISVSSGVVYLNGVFVNVLNPTFGLVNNYTTYAGNNVVGFVLAESIVTSDQDQTLLDGSLGYPNINAPGADRLKLIPTLVSLSPTAAANTSGFNPIATYNYGSLVSTSTSGNNLYSVVNDAIAQRIYDEAGNYVVNPPVVDTVTSVNGNSIIANLSSNNVLARIAPFSGYAEGNYVSTTGTTYVNMRRGIDTAVLNNQQITFNYGSYFVLQEVAGDFDFQKAQTVLFYDTPQQAITTRNFNTAAVTGNNIGSASARCFTYNSGVPGTNTAQYLLHVFNTNMANGWNTSQIKAVYYGTGSTKGVADVLPTAPGLTLASLGEQLYTFGVPGIKSLRDGSNNNNTSYLYRNKTSSTMFANGLIVITLGAGAGTNQTGGTDILPYGVGILPTIDNADYIVTLTANSQTNALAGTISFFNTQNNVVGSGTSFNTNFSVGAQIISGSTVRTVTSISNATYLNVDAFFGSNASAQSYSRYFPSGKQVNINIASVDTPSYVNVTNSTSFSIITGLTPNTTPTVDVTYTVLRSGALPAAKVINKNQYVKINTLTNPTGPWCLGFSDIHQVTGIFAASTNTYSTSGANVMSSFIFDDGQRDTFYNLGYLYAKSSWAGSATPYLLVQLDYFTTNTAAAVGFYTVESYPIDDANTANTSAIQTLNIPVYYDSNGNTIYLRDYVDFRTPVTSTSNNTGVTSLANSTQVTTAISYASYNPSSTVTYSTTSLGLNVPAYGKNFSASYTNYLSRQDLLYVTPSGIIKIKEGVSSTAPQSPLYPENAMAIALLNVPPYPSLSTDQLNVLYGVNQTSKNIIRNTSGAILTSLVTNRGYSMRDIGVLETRITNLEYYASLSLLQQSATNMTVTDSSGLNRFKNGIFVDPFNNFSYCDVSNPEFSIAIDAVDGVARPAIVREVISVQFNAGLSGTVQKTGTLVTLPYTSVPFIVQPYATQYRSAALVAYAWNGTVLLLPSYANHNDTINTGSINITVDNTTAWTQFANSPLAYVYGDWRTTSTDVSTSVVTTPPADTTSIAPVASGSSGTVGGIAGFGTANSPNGGFDQGATGTGTGDQ